MRYKRVKVSGYFLVSMMTEGVVPSVRCIAGLPKGTKFAYSVPDLHWGIWIVVEHESFPELKDGDEIPFLDPIIFERLT